MNLEIKVINPQRTYLNKYTGGATYTATIILKWKNTNKKFNDIYFIIKKWADDNFKNYNYHTEEENKEIILYNIKYSAGTGYNVWFDIIDNFYRNKSLGNFLGIKKENTKVIYLY